MQATKNYIAELKKIDFSQASEVSLRKPFEDYLHNFLSYRNLNNITILHEGKRIGKFGVPDFRISSNSSNLGYIETKMTNENLDKIIKSDQIVKYRELSQNLLITNYIDFVWIKGEIIQHETLCYLSDLENKNFKLDNEKTEKVEKLFLNFFSQIPEKISSSKDLAFALAVRCKNLKDFINDDLLRQQEQKEIERLLDLYNAFKNNIFAELTISEFSDAFAQMLVYGLFLAGLNADTKSISLDNAKKYIPASFQLIKELICFLDELEKPEYKETKWIIDETISIINNIQWFDLKENLSFNKHVKDNENIETDPYIYFYETFLATYDYNLRKAKGVYYTPPQVVNFIVRALNDVLINVFNLTSGLADRNKVTVLDFATGTGTFLIEIFKLIFEHTSKDSITKRDIIIKEHILQNLYGFEYLIAPYTIAHLKLSQFLKENGYEFQENERVQVYLTNTLEPVDKQVVIPFLGQLSRETQAAQKVKDTPILVITGNPPYSGISKNNGKWISEQINKYKFIDGAPLNERKHWLNDDYVKFIRFAQDKMDNAEQGIVGIITNHSFLDNPTFRGMRQSLMNTFDQLYFIDLHGNSSKKEITPEGEKDENVFDIKQGVCISILVKRKGLKQGVFHADFWGKRADKYKLCLENDLKSVKFKELKPNSPFYFFIPKEEKDRKEYETGWKINDIFNLNVSGIVTARDNLCIKFKEEDLKKSIQEFKNLKFSNKEIETKYKVKDNYQWKIDIQRRKSSLKPYNKDLITNILYRPFDIRKIYYDDDIVFRTRKNIMINMQDENIALIGMRQYAYNVPDYCYTFVSKYLIGGRTFVSNKGIPYLYPLYILKNGVEKTFFGVSEPQVPYGNQKIENGFIKIENFKPEFRKFINSLYSTEPIDKKVIKNLENQIIDLQKQLKEIEKSVKTLEKLNTTAEIIEIQKQTIEELKFQIEQKQKELTKYNSQENSNFIPTAEEILGYIYAILHSQTYRVKYAEFLKSDFPLIPFTTNLLDFKNLANLGYKLTQIHLQNEEIKEKEYADLGNFEGDDDNIISTIHFVDNKLYINKNQYFNNISEQIFNFYIGGYQVLDKYLKDRKNLSILPDIEQIENMIKIIAKTIDIMKDINKKSTKFL